MQRWLLLVCFSHKSTGVGMKTSFRQCIIGMVLINIPLANTSICLTCIIHSSKNWKLLVVFTREAQ